MSTVPPIVNSATAALESEDGYKEETSENYTNTESENAFEKSYGVRRIEVLNKQYDKWYHKVAVFFSIFLIAYGYGLDGTIRYTYQTYATSSYAQHSLVSTVTVVRSVAGCVAQLFYARLSDAFGRAELIIVSLILYIVGTIIESQAYDVTRFAAGAILYQFGYSGLIVLLQVITSDFSNMNWRVFCSFIAAFPFVINTWVSGDITNAVLADRTWSWGIGMWAFILPLLSIPLLLCFAHMHFLASKNGDLNRLSGQSDFKRLGFTKFLVEVFFWKLDIVGILSFMLVLGLILTPFTLAGGISSEWKKAKVIVPLVIGFCFIPVLVFWEWKISRHPLLSWELARQKAVWACLTIAVFINLIWYMQGDYIYTILVVGMNESVKSATRISSLYSFVSVLTGTFLGLVIAYVRRLKPFIIFGICMWCVSFGMMIQFRGGSDDSTHSGFIGAQCLLGFGAGFFTYVTQAAIQTVTGHEGMATVLSLYLSFYYIGSALGGTISGAIWTQILPKELAKRISDPASVLAAYSSPFTWIITYTNGTPERAALIEAYKHVQRILVAVGLAFCFPLLLVALMLDNPRLESTQNLKDAEFAGEQKLPASKESRPLWKRILA